jgi:DNA-binding ferritin-like protein
VTAAGESLTQAREAAEEARKLLRAGLDPVDEGRARRENFHWHISGPHFRDYHLLLDEQADQLFDTTDAIAERVRKIGGMTLRSIGHVTRLQRVLDNASEWQGAQRCVTPDRATNAASAFPVLLAFRASSAKALAALCIPKPALATGSAAKVAGSSTS